MKNRIVILIFAGLLVISFAGCNNKTQNKTTADQETGTEAVESVASGTEESDDTTSTSEEPETQNKAETIRQDEIDGTAEKEKKADGKAQSETQNTGQTTVETKQTVQTEKAGATEQQTESKAAETKTPETTPTQTPTKTPQAEETKTEAPKVEETPASKPSATAADTKAVADKVLEYINSYRSSPATKLSGLTGYAEYRSRQLIGNFAHDTTDERAAATALKYGSYIDPALYGIEGTPYYTVNAREAIAKAGYTGTVDEVAESLAKLVKNSQSHWKYVGDSAYQYIGVGITYESGMWYCDIAVAAENTDNN